VNDDKETAAREHLLEVAHAVIGERICAKAPHADDATQAEHNDIHLIMSARAFVEATNHIVVKD
jgi:hypothetical protein